MLLLCNLKRVFNWAHYANQRLKDGFGCFLLWPIYHLFHNENESFAVTIFCPPAPFWLSKLGRLLLTDWLTDWLSHLDQCDERKWDGDYVIWSTSETRLRWWQKIRKEVDWNEWNGKRCKHYSFLSHPPWPHWTEREDATRRRAPQQSLINYCDDPPGKWQYWWEGTVTRGGGGRETNDRQRAMFCHRWKSCTAWMGHWMAGSVSGWLKCRSVGDATGTEIKLQISLSDKTTPEHVLESVVDYIIIRVPERWWRTSGWGTATQSST